MIITLDKRFRKQAKGAFEKYQFEVGILQDAPHRTASTKGLASYAGGPVRRMSRKLDSKSVAGVSEDLRKRTGLNFYTAPFRSIKNRDILKFAEAFFKLCTGKGEARRATNYLQAIVRNPILRGDYGSNSRATRKIKGFNRYMIDTAQLFKAIKARVVIKNVSR